MSQQDPQPGRDRGRVALAVAAALVPVLVVAQFAWLATLPVTVAVVLTLVRRPLRRLCGWAVFLAVTYALPYLVWKTRPSPARSLSRDLDPVLAVLVGVAALALLVATLARPVRTGPARRVAGAAFALAAVGYGVTEAVSAAAWDRRRYSYVADYLAFLGSPDVGTVQGTTVSSPLWPVMDVGWVATGLLTALAVVLLTAPLRGALRLLLRALAAVEVLGLGLFAAYPLGPTTLADGLLGWYLAGAFGAIVAGNAVVLVAGLSWRRLALPRWLGRAGVVLGGLGVVSIAATYGWMPIGLAERISVYSFLAWELVAGLALLSRRPVRAPAAARPRHAPGRSDR